MTEYYLPDIPRIYTALAERISDFYRWGKTDFLDPLYDICGFSDGCFCFLLL